MPPPGAGAVGLGVEPDPRRLLAKRRLGKRRPADIAEADEEDLHRHLGPALLPKRPALLAKSKAEAQSEGRLDGRGPRRRAGGVPAPRSRISRYAWYALFVLVPGLRPQFRRPADHLDPRALTSSHDLSVADDEIGFLYGTAFAVFYALFGIPLGRLADSWYRGRLIAIGLGLWSSMTALSGFASNFAMLATARIGVGIGEASASPAAYSMISDYFPKEKRATALSIYSAGLYIGGGLSLPVGGFVTSRWNHAFPNPAEAPLGLHGWQAAFLAVGIPGPVAGASWVLSLREPQRGAMDGQPQPVVRPNAWRDFGARAGRDHAAAHPFSVARIPGRPADQPDRRWLVVVTAASYGLILLTGDWPQWLAYGLGVYAVFSWVQSLRARDPAAYRLIWGNRTVMMLAVAFGSISFMTYAIASGRPPYAIRDLLRRRARQPAQILQRMHGRRGGGDHSGLGRGDCRGDRGDHGRRDLRRLAPPRPARPHLRQHARGGAARARGLDHVHHRQPRDLLYRQPLRPVVRLDVGRRGGGDAAGSRPAADAGDRGRNLCARNDDGRPRARPLSRRQDVEGDRQPAAPASSGSTSSRPSPCSRSGSAPAASPSWRRPGSSARGPRASLSDRREARRRRSARRELPDGIGPVVVRCGVDHDRGAVGIEQRIGALPPCRPATGSAKSSRPLPSAPTCRLGRSPRCAPRGFSRPCCPPGRVPVRTGAGEIGRVAAAGLMEMHAVGARAQSRAR